jgi:hypothetical protein
MNEHRLPFDRLRVNGIEGLRVNEAHISQNNNAVRKGS